MNSDLKLIQQESSDIRSPSPSKENLKQITSLLDDDEECFCQENMKGLIMSRQKSKTDYSKRTNQLRKESMVSTIQEVDPLAEEAEST